MFSTTKLVAAAAILALVGGFVSSGVLTTQPDEPTPGAEADLWTGEYLDQSDFVAVTGEASFGAGPGVVTGSSVMSDPRVSGDYNVGYQWLCAPDDTCTTWGRVVLSNDGGTWEGDFVGINGPISAAHEENLMIWLNGTGDYEGWSYVANFTGPMSATTGNGLLVAAPLPPQAALSFPEVAAE